MTVFFISHYITCVSINYPTNDTIRAKSDFFQLDWNKMGEFHAKKGGHTPSRKTILSLRYRIDAASVTGIGSCIYSGNQIALIRSPCPERSAFCGISRIPSAGILSDR